MSRLEIETVIRAVLVGSLGPSVAAEPAPTREGVAAWDSLKHMEIVFAVEDALDVRFADGDLARLTSLDALVGHAEALRAA